MNIVIFFRDTCSIESSVVDGKLGIDYWRITEEIITAYEALKFKDSDYAFFSYKDAVTKLKEKLESKRIEIESKIIEFQYNLKTIDKLSRKLQ